MSQERIYADGFVFIEGSSATKEWKVGRLSIKVSDAISFLEKYQNERGWVNISLKKSTGGNMYLELDTWEPNSKPIEQGPVPMPEGVEYPEGPLEDPPF